MDIERPRLRGFDGKEQPVPSWEAAVAEDWLGKWAMNQMLINVATRKFARSVRLPEGTFQRPPERVCRNRPPPAALWRCRLSA